MVLNEWEEFLDRCRIRRILNNDEFSIVWRAVKQDLGMQDPVVEDDSKNEHHDNPNDREKIIQVENGKEPAE